MSLLARMPSASCRISCPAHVWLTVSLSTQDSMPCAIRLVDARLRVRVIHAQMAVRIGVDQCQHYYASIHVDTLATLQAVHHCNVMTPRCAIGIVPYGFTVALQRRRRRHRRTRARGAQRTTPATTPASMHCTVPRPARLHMGGRSDRHHDRRKRLPLSEAPPLQRAAAPRPPVHAPSPPRRQHRLDGARRRVPQTRARCS